MVSHKNSRTKCQGNLRRDLFELFIEFPKALLNNPGNFFLWYHLSFNRYFWFTYFYIFYHILVKDKTCLFFYTSICPIRLHLIEWFSSYAESSVQFVLGLSFQREKKHSLVIHFYIFVLVYFFYLNIFVLF